MNISFSGIKNAGSHVYVQENDEVLNKGAAFELVIPKGKHINLHVELTNEGSKDLDDFKEILKTYPNKFNPNTLNIDYDEFINIDTGKKEKSYFINDKNIEMNSSTFPVFNKIFKLMEKIKNMAKDEFKTDNSYITSDEAKDAFAYYEPYCNNHDEYMKIIDKSHNADKTRKGAEYLSRRFEKPLIDYILQ